MRVSTHASLVTLLLAAATLLAHGWCLNDGAVLDDWQHQKALRENGWAMDELLRSLVIEPSQFLSLWWQDKPVRWEYPRPAFILVMKLVYHVLGGDNPFWLHALSLLLHFASAVMIWRLVLWLSCNRFWSAAAGLLFIVYQHAVMTVQWSSSQNCIIQTALTLAALLCYVRGGGLHLFALDAAAPRDQTPPQPSWPSIMAAILLWIAAVLTKENALVLPAILAAFDLSFGGWRTVLARFRVYVLLGLLAAVFVGWRMQVVTQGMPDVYFRRPEGDWLEYAGWCAAKLLHYLCTSIWPAPMTIGPTGRYNPWIESTADCLAMLAIVVALGAGYWIAARRVRGWWIWPLWILLSVLPLLPVVATAHSGYMGGVGYAIGVVLGPIAYDRRQLLKKSAAETPSDSSTWQRVGWLEATVQSLSRLVAVAAILAMCGLTLLNRWQWTGIIAAERWVPAWVQTAPPPASARHIFFINLPFVNLYAPRVLTAQLGPRFERTKCHALTFAPQPVLLEQRTIVEQIDEHSFTVEIEGQPYFSRLLGRFLIDGFRSGGPLQAGEIVLGEDVAVRVIAADEQGVRKLSFVFEKPLNSPEYCFYLTSPDVGAARLRFHGPSPADAAPAASQSPQQNPAHKGGVFLPSQDRAQPNPDHKEGAFRQQGALLRSQDRTEPNPDHKEGAFRQERALLRSQHRTQQSPDRKGGVFPPHTEEAGRSSAGDVVPDRSSSYEAASAEYLGCLDADDVDPACLARLEHDLRPLAAFMARATAAPIQRVLEPVFTPPDPLAPPPRIRRPQPLPSPPPLSAKEWRQVRDWWRRDMDESLVHEVWEHRHDFDALVKAREEVPHARQWAALLVHSDLYLTGPPFPGPRPPRRPYPAPRRHPPGNDRD